MKKLGFLTSAVVLLGLATIASAGPITLIDSSTLGYYNSGLGDLYTRGSPDYLFPGPEVSTGDPTFGPNTAEPTSLGPNIGTWLGNFAPTGALWSTALVQIPKTWEVNDETAIVYKIDAGNYGLSKVHFDMGVDNGIFVWVDGIYKFGAMQGGGSDINEYNLDIASLSSGTHYVEILREDHGGSTGFDILAKGDLNLAPVPEPASMVLLGTGLLGVAATARRKLKK